jgi:hypothetical protein
MRLLELADAKASLQLWKLVNDCVWKAISVQAKKHGLQTKNCGY